MKRVITVLSLCIPLFFVSLQSQTPVFFKYTTNTGSNHIIAIPSQINPNINGIPLADGDEIGVFTVDRICAGAVVWKKVTTSVTAWGANSTSKTKGFSSDELIQFRIYSKLQKKTYYATVEFGQAINGSKFISGGISILKSIRGTTLVSVENQNLPDNFSLNQNYPNPFNPTTMINYSVPSFSKVSIVIYDMLGKEITRLLNNELINPGNYNLFWNGLNSSGTRTSSGTYFYKMDALGMNSDLEKNIFSEVKTMILLK